jgi:hypothetical protein
MPGKDQSPLLFTVEIPLLPQNATVSWSNSTVQCRIGSCIACEIVSAISVELFNMTLIRSMQIKRHRQYKIKSQSEALVRDGNTSRLIPLVTHPSFRRTAPISDS